MATQSQALSGVNTAFRPSNAAQAKALAAVNAAFAPTPQTGGTTASTAPSGVGSSGASLPNNNPNPQTGSTSAPIASGGSATPTSSSYVPPVDTSSTTPPASNLQPGQSGTNVQQLQSYLESMGLLNANQINGTYDPNTTAAVASLQKQLGVQPGNYPGYYGPQTQKAISQKYQNAFQATQGTAAPQSGSAAMSQLQPYINSTTQSSSDPVLAALSSNSDPIMGALTQVLSNINNPALTNVSLQNEYNQMASQYNLPAMQSQLMNMQNVMNGSEQDIRDEITSTGGTATDSMVLGLTAARNKVILKQYNALDTNYQAAVSNVQNMMQYASDDRSYQLQQQQAVAGITENLASIEMQRTSMGMTMQQNALSNYQWQIGNFGPQQFVSLLGGNTTQAEQVLGYAPGSLSNPSFVASLQVKWQSQQLLAASKAYMTAYGTLPPGLSFDASGNIVPNGTPAPGGTNTSAPTSTIVGGVDFGTTASGVKPYATDINSEVTGVSRAYNDITQSFGQNPSASQLSQYIYNNAPNSPVTGDMITTAAKDYGVSPAILAATLNNESSFGTAGAAVNTYNPGNVGNTGTSTKNMGTWQAGVDATAQNLAIRQTGLTPAQVNSPLYSQALGLANYTVSPSSLSKRSASYNQILSMANTISMNTTGQPYDVGQAQIWYDYANQTGTQNTLNYLSALVGTKNNGGNLQSLINISDTLGRTNYPAMNNIQAWTKFQTGNPQIASYYTAVTEVSDQVAKILQGGGTGSGTSDAKLQQAQSLFDTGFSGSQIKAVASTLQTLLQNRASSIIGNNPYLVTQASNLGINLNPTITVISPSGNSGTIPQDQLQSALQQGYTVQ